MTYKLKQKVYKRKLGEDEATETDANEMSFQDPRKFESNSPVDRRHVTEHSIPYPYPFGSLRRRILAMSKCFADYTGDILCEHAFRLVNGKRFDVCAFLEVCSTC